MCLLGTKDRKGSRKQGWVQISETLVDVIYRSPLLYQASTNFQRGVTNASCMTQGNETASWPARARLLFQSSSLCELPTHASFLHEPHECEGEAAFFHSNAEFVETALRRCCQASLFSIRRSRVQRGRVRMMSTLP